MMRPLLALACILRLAAADAAMSDDARAPLRVGAGYHLLNPDARSFTSTNGWSLGADARLPVPGLVGTSHADLDWRANNGSDGRFDALSLCYAERKALDASGLYLGLGAGLGWNRLVTEPPALPARTPSDLVLASTLAYASVQPDTVGFRPLAKLIAGVALPLRDLPVGIEAAYLIGPRMHGTRTDGLVVDVVWRFGDGWYLP